jgi:MscS family membrane protein
VFVFAIGALTVVSAFGYPIATILAGLGIGGIAVALGAQKSLEHFFGSISIGVDQPFRVGDWLIVNGVEGDVMARPTPRAARAAPGCRGRRCNRRR